MTPQQGQTNRRWALTPAGRAVTDGILRQPEPPVWVPVLTLPWRAEKRRAA